MTMDLILGVAVVIGAILLMPVVVVGTWAMIVYGIVGAADGLTWLFERRWDRRRARLRTTLERTLPAITPNASSGSDVVHALRPGGI